MTVRPAGVGDDHALAALNRFVHDVHLARRPDYFKTARADEAAACRELLASLAEACHGAGLLEACHYLHYLAMP